MKSHIKALAVILAAGAISQAVYAYANQPSGNDGSDAIASQCDELRAKLTELLEREKARNRFEAQWASPELRDKRVDQILSELEVMLDRPHEKVEPGP
jgi:hypothetical protein